MMRGSHILMRLPYRWRYVVVTVPPLTFGLVGYFALAPWALLIGAAATALGVWFVTASHHRWLRSATMSTISTLGIDSSHRLEVAGRSEEARLALAVNRLASRAILAVGRAESIASYHETILDAIADGVMVIDDRGGMLYFNSAAQLMFGLADLTEEDNAPPLASKINAFEVAEAAATCLTTGSVQRVNIQLFNPSRHLVLWAAPINVQGHNEQRALLIVTDRTQEHRQSESLSEFVANASHELRTPITVIQTSVETLKQGWGLDGLEAEFLDNIETSGKKMGRLVAELMELTMIETRQTALNLAPVAVNDLIQATYAELRSVARKQGVALETQLGDESPYVSADFDKLQLAVSNLVTNAIKFSSPGDKVRIDADVVGTTVNLNVVDEGRGIDPNDVPHIFERFYRKNYEQEDDQGFGLGLAIVKNIVELHEGTVDVDSQLTAGSKFTISLPLSASPLD